MTENTKLTVTQLDEKIRESVKQHVGETVKDQIQKTLGEMTESKGNPLEAPNISRGAQPEVQKLSNDEKSIGAARYVRAMAATGGDLEKAQQFATRAEKAGRWDDHIGKTVQGTISKALEAGSFTAGGSLLPDVLGAGLIDALRARSVIRRAGPTTMPLNNGRLTLRRISTDAAASYVGESQNISNTEPAFDQIVMTAKKLAAIVPISNDLLRFDADITADNAVRENLVSVMATTEDRAFIRFDGTQNRPKGLRWQAATGQVTNSNGTSSANVETDIRELWEDLASSNIPMNNPVFLMSPRSRAHLLTLRDSSGGQLVFPDMRNANPSILGFPVLTTTNIPDNLGSGDESEVYLVDMSQAVIAEAQSMQVDVDSSASYVQGGSLVSAFSQDETAIRVIQEHDFAMRHPEAIAIKSGVTWGTSN